MEKVSYLTVLLLVFSVVQWFRRETLHHLNHFCTRNLKNERT